MPMIRRTLAVALPLAMGFVCAACTVLVNSSTSQCQTDSDCAHFGGHPYCQNSVCVSSGLGPSSCFYGSPAQSQDFLNQCSTAECLPFDNCERIGICGSTSADAGLVAPPVAEAGAASNANGSDDGGPTLPNCVDPSSGRAQVIYMTGSSNFPPLLAKLAPLIAATGYTPVYQVTNSCAGVAAIFAQTPLTDPAPASNAKYAAYVAQDGSSVPCLIGPAGTQADVGESDIFSTTCNAASVPGASVGEYLGPIQAMAFVVPGKSQEVAISAEAARAVFGMGGDNDKATPWIDPSLYFVRNASTGTQQMVGKAISVPPNQFWGIDRGSAANVDALMRVISDATLAEQAIGIISADYYDSDRANLKALGFKATEQDCAYMPDSTAYKKDKQNVRDGHYPIWGPLHFFTTVSNGVPVSAAAQAFVSVVSVPNLPEQLLAAFIGSSLVPTCAMGVQRSAELGPVSPYSAPYQCNCYFEATVSGETPAGCNGCTTANDCNDPTRPACNLGYCEVQ
jgi:ABC-type phosphate transport system substrate-binding protein